MTEEEKIAAAAAEAGVQTQAHAEPDGDEGAAAAAAGGEEAAAAAAGEEAPAGADALEGSEAGNGDDDDVLGKSFDVKTESGGTVKAYDATALLKSLNDRIGLIEGALSGSNEESESIAKSLSSIAEVLKKNASEIDSLKKSIDSMGDQGRGRKAVLSVFEKPAAATLEKGGMAEGAMGRKEFMAKADEAMKAGRISGGELSLAETYLNRGGSVPEGIVSRVMGNQ